MPIISNHSLLQKADMRVADLASGGLLLSQQAKKLIELAVKKAVILKIADVETLKAQKKLLEKSSFESRVLRAGVEATALPESDRTKPDMGKRELDTKLFKAEVRLSRETLEDNIEGPRFEQTVISMLSKAIARDMDEVMINGDTGSSDAFLAQFDGLLAQANVNVANALDNTLNKKVLNTTMKAMPSEWLEDKTKMVFLTSVDAALDYSDSVSDRMTQLGDNEYMRGAFAPYGSIPVIYAPMFPENIASTVPGSSELTTNVIFTDPKNMRVGIWRKITIETDKDISSQEYIIVAHLRFDMKLVEQKAAVKTINVAFAGL